MRRLRSAILVARAYPATLETSSAADFVDALEPADGHLTVLWHSVMWQYIGPDEQQRIRARLDRIGAASSLSAPFAYITFEPRRLEPGGVRRFVVTARTWPGGQERILGEAPPHGVPVRWGPLVSDDRRPAPDGPQWPH